MNSKQKEMINSNTAVSIHQIASQPFTTKEDLINRMVAIRLMLWVGYRNAIMKKCKKKK